MTSRFLAYVTLATVHAGRDLGSRTVDAVTDDEAPPGGGGGSRAIVIYTVLRIAMFLLVWLTLELLTPISGVWALVVALLVSGALSLVLLDRQRNRVGAVAAGFFGRINDRIDAAARAEDDDSSPVAGIGAGIPATGDDPSVSGEGEQGAEGQAVDQDQDPGLLEGRDQRRPDGTS